MRGRPLQLDKLGQTSAANLLNTVKRHGILQIIHREILNQHIQGLPTAITSQLAYLANIGIARDILLNEATQKTLLLLAENNIPALLLKGTPIAHKYFSDTFLRTRLDTDLLIREQDKQLTSDLLETNNYTIFGLDHRKHTSKQFIAGLDNNTPLVTTFDIHWKLSNRTLFNNSLQFDECWKARQSVKQLGENAFSLSAEHLLIHACIHRIAHERNRDRNRLIWLYDIHLIASEFSDREFGSFLNMAITKGIGALCADGLIMSQYYFGTRYPRSYLTELMRQKSDEATAKLITASKLRWAMADIHALRGYGAKFGMLREMLIPAFQTSNNTTDSTIRSVFHHLRSKMSDR